MSAFIVLLQTAETGCILPCIFVLRADIRNRGQERKSTLSFKAPDFPDQSDFRKESQSRFLEIFSKYSYKFLDECYCGMWKTSLQANYYKNDIKAQCWAQFTTQGGKIRLEVNLMMKQTGGQRVDD